MRQFRNLLPVLIGADIFGDCLPVHIDADVLHSRLQDSFLPRRLSAAVDKVSTEHTNMGNIRF